jgi:hypothetical protein
LLSALARQGARGNTTARAQALELVAAPSRLLRIGAAQALGGFADPAAEQALFRLAEDPDADVRREAVRALGSHRSPSRAEFLGRRLARADLTAAERAETSLARARATPDPATRERQLREAAARLRDPAVGGERAQALAYDLLRGFAQEPAARALAVELLAQPGLHPEVQAQAARTLASVGDALFEEQAIRILSQGGQSPDAARAEILRALPARCPAGRWRVLAAGLGADSPETRDLSLRTALRLAEDRTGDFLRTAAGNRALARQQRKLAADLLADWRRNPRPRACPAR